MAPTKLRGCETELGFPSRRSGDPREDSRRCNGSGCSTASIVMQVQSVRGYPNSARQADVERYAMACQAVRTLG